MENGSVEKNAASEQPDHQSGTSEKNLEDDSSKGSGVVPRRKRGRPVGSKSGSVVGGANGAQAPIGPTRARSTRRRCGVLESAISALRPRSKKRKFATRASSSTEGAQSKKQQVKANAPSRSAAEESSAAAPSEAVPPISEDKIPLSTWIAEADRPTVEKDPPVTSMPFAKTSPVWEVIDSMEVFRKMPQSPHFRPLLSRSENIREGLAVGTMVIFSGLVEKISKFTFDDHVSILEGYLETLKDLETHGFRVAPIRGRVKGLLGIKNKYDEAQALSRALTREKEAMAEVDEAIEDIDQQIRRLQEERAVAKGKKAEKDNEIGTLQARFNALRDFVDGARQELERLANAPW